MEFYVMERGGKYRGRMGISSVQIVRRMICVGPFESFLLLANLLISIWAWYYCQLMC
jgi:hypothetical protein